MKSSNFLENAPSEKIIESVKHFQKCYGVKIYKQREELMEVVRMLALDHGRLAEIEKQSYVTSFVHALSRMKLDDEQVWGSLAAYLAQKMEVFDERDLAN